MIEIVGNVAMVMIIFDMLPQMVKSIRTRNLLIVSSFNESEAKIRANIAIQRANQHETNVIESEFALVVSRLLKDGEWILINKNGKFTSIIF